MPWRQVGTRRYYQQSVRRNGRPVQVYFGKGAVAELAAAVADLRRVERVIETRERLAEQKLRDEAEAPLLELCRATDLLAHAALAVVGYYRHDRGQWRRRREHGRKK